MMLLGSQHYRLEMQFGRSVSRMTDDMNIRIRDNLNHAVRVLFGRAALVTQRMNTCNSQVKQVEVKLIQIQVAFTIQDIDFSAQQQVYAIHLARHDIKVAEINGIARARNTGSMVGYAQQLQSLIGSCPHHFLQRAERVPAGDCMGMYI